MGNLVYYGFIALAFWLIRRDIARRSDLSAAVWIPTLWVGIIASRPLSMWLGFGGGENSLEGSPMDRNFYFGMILLALVVLARRPQNWAQILSTNWPVFLYYSFFLVSVLWADSPFVSFKRWFKDFGNVAIALVILTEKNPEEAFRAVFVRCAYVLLPLSVIYIRYFPNIGRNYNIHSGGMEAIGVTTQKNSLGALALVVGLVLIWDWLERTRPESRKLEAVERYMPFLILLLGLYLLYLCDSKTSILCLGIGGVILFSARMPLLQRRIGALGVYSLIATVTFFVLDSVFGIRGALLESMGRDATLTGRTEVWRELLDLRTDPIFGTGFCSFWSDESFQSKLPEWVSSSAHNGYLETYIDGGMLGLFFLSILLVAVAWKVNRLLSTGSRYALIRFAALVTTLVGNVAESHFGRMTPLWFLFLLVAIDPPSGQGLQAPARADAFDSTGLRRPVPHPRSVYGLQSLVSRFSAARLTLARSLPLQLSIAR